jgi:hypothetical protein
MHPAAFEGVRHRGDLEQRKLRGGKDYDVQLVARFGMTRDKGRDIGRADRGERLLVNRQHQFSMISRDCPSRYRDLGTKGHQRDARRRLDDLAEARGDDNVG